MGELRMSRKERRRLEVFSRLKRGEVTRRKAAELLGLSYRQVKRSYGRFVQQGDEGLVHGLRGKASNNRSGSARHARALQRYREQYDDFGPTLAAEYLSGELGEPMATTTLRRWLLAAGLWHKTRRRAVHRSWRARKEHRGELVQMDGSRHDWFEGRRAQAVLMVMIDDATNLTYGRFFEEETTAAAMGTFAGYVAKYGLPQALYVDRDSIYETTREASSEESLRASGAVTQFGRAMQELEVKLQLAHSPQAKGRVERRHGLFQDRLVKSLRLAGISDLDGANALLEREFLPMLAERFVVAAKHQADLHRRLPGGVRLERVLSMQESRVVQNDWTVSWRNRWFQLTAGNHRLSLAKRRVVVSEQLDGTIELLYRGRSLGWEELPERPGRAASKRRVGPTGVGRVGQRPAADHPWRGRGSVASAALVSAGALPAAAARPPRSASVAALPALREAGGRG